MTSISRQIAASGDDVRWTPSGAFNAASCYFGYQSLSHWNAGFRFANITIPKGALIIAATLGFVADVTNTGANINTVIAADAQDNAAAPTSAADANGRTTTTATVLWTPAGWTASSAQSSPDISAVIQEIVNRAGWASGNALVVYVKDDGTSSAQRTPVDYGTTPANAATLNITYVIGGSASLPTAASLSGSGDVTAFGAAGLPTATGLTAAGWATALGAAALATAPSLSAAGIIVWTGPEPTATLARARATAAVAPTTRPGATIARQAADATLASARATATIGAAQAATTLGA